MSDVPLYIQTTFGQSFLEALAATPIIPDAAKSKYAAAFELSMQVRLKELATTRCNLTGIKASHNRLDDAWIFEIDRFVLTTEDRLSVSADAVKIISVQSHLKK